MSSWLSNQTQEAFQLWRRYLAMGLHFRATGYDYTVYGGMTNATLEAFKKKREWVSLFTRLNLRLKAADINPEHFLFAHALNDSLSVQRLLNGDTMKVWENWFNAYGTPENYTRTAANLLRGVVDGSPPKELLIKLLDDSKYLELIAFLTKDSDLFNQVLWAVEDNALLKMQFNKVIKRQKLYSYFCII